MYQEYNLDEVDLEDPPEEFTGKTRNQAMIEAADEFDWQPIQEAIRSATKAVGRIFVDLDFKDLAASLQSIEEHYLEIQQALESSIQEIDNPENYDPNDIDIDPKAQKIGIESTASFLKDINESNRNRLDGYISRIDKGLESYLNEEYMLVCFIFISIQDGLMEMLCSEQRKTPNGDGYYTSSQKREALKEAYEQIDHGYYEVDASKI